MHGLIAPTKILRRNLNKVGAASVIVGPEPEFKIRRVRLTLPSSIIIGLSADESVSDIANGVRTYTWPEFEGPQTNLVFYITGEQSLSAILSPSSPDGLAPRFTVIIEYPETAHPE